MAKGRKTGGRRKGSANRIPLSVKEALLDAFDRRGGVDALVKWADNDPAAFYGLWGRLAPRELTGAGGGPLTLTVTFERESRKATSG